VAVLYHTLIMSGIYIILTTSLNLVAGYTGLFSFCHGAFYAIGAYAGALLTLKLGFPFWAEVLGAACIAGLGGIAIGFPTLRVRGGYLALATYGFAVIIFTILNNWESLTRGPLGIRGIPHVNLFGIVFNSLWSFTLLVAFFVFVTIFCLWRLTQSSFGKVLLAIREDETAALAIGKNIARLKVTSFCIGAFFAGIAGTLYAHYVRFIDPTAFVAQESFLVYNMVILGGRGSLPGSVLAALLLVFVPEALRFLGLPGFYAVQLRQMIYGALIVVILIYRPQGILGKTYKT
jgi:branched-chain amino acid transport system permease protein